MHIHRERWRADCLFSTCLPMLSTYALGILRPGPEISEPSMVPMASHGSLGKPWFFVL